MNVCAVAFPQLPRSGTDREERAMPATKLGLRLGRGSQRSCSTNEIADRELARLKSSKVEERAERGKGTNYTRLYRRQDADGRYAYAARRLTPDTY